MSAINRRQTAFIQRHGQKLIALTLWTLLLSGYWWYVKATHLSWQATLVQWQTSVYAPLLYIGLYALRPLLFFPSIALSVAGGVLFGAVNGILYTTLAANASAMTAYGVGYYFGLRVFTGDASIRLLDRYMARLRTHSFATVLILRCLFFPYDLVSYFSGFLHIDWKPFLWATALGNLPGTISFVLLGAAGSVDLVNGKFKLNLWALALSGGLIVVSLAISRYVKQREPSSKLR